jgi:Na+-translocating ferredoxin:NAD+ oxidoreductase RnfE subunit
MDPRNVVSIGLVTAVIVLAFLRMMSWFDGIVNTTLRVLIFVVVICTAVLLAFSAVKKLKR